MDSDSIYTTNQPQIVAHAKYCYENYPTIVNNIPKEKTSYSNTPLDYATVDNNLAKSQLTIGESSNLAQIALTYTYNFDDTKYSDYVCILSVIAQASIDSAKRRFDIDIPSEIKRIKNDMDIKKNGYPKFWLSIRRDFDPKKINYNLLCPMNYLADIKLKRFKVVDRTLPMAYFIQTFELEDTRRKCKKVEELIQKYSLMLYTSEEADYILCRSDFDVLINDIKQIYISKGYLGLMSWLIERAFFPIKVKDKTTLNKNKPILLKTLYDINPNNLLKIFSKNLTF